MTTRISFFATAKNALPLASLLLLTFITSCKNDSLTPPPSICSFTNSSVNVTESGNGKKIEITFLSPAQNDFALNVAINEVTAVYGTDYTTSPSGNSGTNIIVPVAKGALKASFTITPLQQITVDVDRQVNFSITPEIGTVEPGATTTCSITIIDDDLVLYLPFISNATDASHYGNSVTVDAATMTLGRTGILNTAYQMNGSSDYIKIANATVLDTIHQITLTAWIKPVSFEGNGNSAIIEKAFTSHTDPYYQYKLALTGDTNPNYPGSFDLSLSINGAYKILGTASNTWAPGNWYFVVGTYDGATMKIYVNGTLSASMPMTGNIDNWGQDIYIARSQNVNVFTPGTFGDMRIYNRALSASEISTLYLR